MVYFSLVDHVFFEPRRTWFGYLIEQTALLGLRKQDIDHYVFVALFLGILNHKSRS